MADYLTTHPKLYKMDSAGKIRVWWIVANDYGSEPHPYYEMSHGVKDGKIQSSKTFIKQGKNIGRANATTAWEQCQLEAKSLWLKQRDRKGYSETIPTTKPLRPMLAKPYSEKYAKYPGYAQPKLDGIRCFARMIDGKVRLFSRTNKEFMVLGHIVKALEPTFKDRPNLILDGELYNHEMRDDFQDLCSAIRRDKPIENSSIIQYHVYDVVQLADFWERSAWLKDHLVIDNDGSIWNVETSIVGSHECLAQEFTRFLDAGYEGAMFRNQYGKYDINRRSPNLLKFKEFMDLEFMIVDAFENKGKQEGECTFTCVTESGARFNVKPRGKSEQRRQYWEDWLKGKINVGSLLTVKFFEWTTSDDPVPRFPVGIGIRDYE